MKPRYRKTFNLLLILLSSEYIEQESKSQIFNMLLLVTNESIKSDCTIAEKRTCSLNLSNMKSSSLKITKSQKSFLSLNGLSVDLKLLILGYVDQITLSNISRVDKEWKELSMCLLYKYPKLTSSRSIKLFLHQLEIYPQYQKYVRKISFYTKPERDVPNLISEFCKEKNIVSESFGIYDILREEAKETGYSTSDCTIISPIFLRFAALTRNCEFDLYSTYNDSISCMSLCSQNPFPSVIDCISKDLNTLIDRCRVWLQDLSEWSCLNLPLSRYVKICTFLLGVFKYKIIPDILLVNSKTISKSGQIVTDKCYRFSKECFRLSCAEVCFFSKSNMRFINIHHLIQYRTMVSPDLLDMKVLTGCLKLQGYQLPSTQDWTFATKIISVIKMIFGKDSYDLNFAAFVAEPRAFTFESPTNIHEILKELNNIQSNGVSKSLLVWKKQLWNNLVHFQAQIEITDSITLENFITKKRLYMDEQNLFDFNNI